MGPVEGACTEDEAEVLWLRYGNNFTLQATGDAIGMTASQVRTQESKELINCRTGTAARIFKAKYENIISSAYHGAVSGFKITWTSATEWTTLKLYELEEEVGLM